MSGECLTRQGVRDLNALGPKRAKKPSVPRECFRDEMHEWSPWATVQDDCYSTVSTRFCHLYGKEERSEFRY